MKKVLLPTLLLGYIALSFGIFLFSDILYSLTYNPAWVRSLTLNKLIWQYLQLIGDALLIILGAICIFSYRLLSKTKKKELLKRTEIVNKEIKKIGLKYVIFVSIILLISTHFLLSVVDIYIFILINFLFGILIVWLMLH